jgi:hypothetical protein
LKNITLPKVETLPSSAFYGCTSLEFCDLPKATSIGQNAFALDKNLKTLILRSETLCTLASVEAIYALARPTVYVPSDLIEDYKVATNWSSRFSAGVITFAPIEGSEYE